MAESEKKVPPTVCEILEEMKAQLEQHQGHEFEPLILMQLEAHQRGCIICQRENKKRGSSIPP